LGVRRTSQHCFDIERRESEAKLTGPQENWQVIGIARQFGQLFFLMLPERNGATNDGGLFFCSLKVTGEFFDELFFERHAGRVAANLSLEAHFVLEF